MRWFRDVVQALPYYSYNEPPPEDLYPGAEPRLEGKKIVTPGGDGGVLSWLKNPSKSPLPLGSEDLTDAQLAELQQSLISDREAAAPVPNEDLLGYADLDLRRHQNGSTGGYGTGGGPAFTADELATLGTVAEVAAGIVAEPIDWALTVREIYNDPKNPLSYAGLIPFVPTGVGKLAKEALQAADKGGEVGGAVGRFADAATAAAKAVGQVHHVISKKVYEALQDHPSLSGHYRPRDPRFTTQAIDNAAHNGYETWHRALDDEVVAWLRRPANKSATPEQFEAWLRSRYAEPDLQKKFPNGF